MDLLSNTKSQKRDATVAEHANDALPDQPTLKRAKFANANDSDDADGIEDLLRESESSAKKTVVIGDQQFHDRKGKDSVSSLNSFLDTVRVLPNARAVTADGEGGAIAPSAVNLRAVFEPDVVDRMRKLEIIKNANYAVNLAMAEPNDYEFRSSIVYSKAANRPAFFFTIGKLQYSATHKSGTTRQVAVTVSDTLYPRFMAVLSSIYGQKTFLVNTFRQGLSFGTYFPMTRPDDKEDTTFSGLSPTKGSRAKSTSASPSSTILTSKAPVTLPYDTDIPVLQGLDAFSPSSFMKLDQIDGDPETGSAVMVGFTVKKYKLRNSTKVVTNDSHELTEAISFGAQFLILLASRGHPPRIPSPIIQDIPLKVEEDDDSDTEGVGVESLLPFDDCEDLI